MKISSFILVIHSYLLRKGMISILNRIQGVRVKKEFGADDPYLPYLESHPVDYLIMCQSEFNRALDLFMNRPELLERTILLQDTAIRDIAPDTALPDAYTSIQLNENKESIILKIQKMLDRKGMADHEKDSRELSPREITIVRLVSMGLTNRQIADKLFLSAHTVMTHRKNISGKLGIKSVSGLTIYAIVNNIITIEEVSSLPSR